MPGLEAVRRMIDSALRPIRQRVLMVVARGILESTKDDGGIQLVKISLLKDETREDIERVQQFGFSSFAPAGSEVVAVFVGGNREHGFVISEDDRSTRQKDLAEGESVQYNAAGQFQKIKANGDLEQNLAQLLATLSGNMEVTSGGDIKLTGNKFQFQGSGAEVLDLFEQTLTALIAEPFIVNKATFTQIKSDLAGIKV